MELKQKNTLGLKWVKEKKWVKQKALRQKS